MTYKVAKPNQFLYGDARKNPYDEPIPYIEFDSREQFEEMAKHSNAYMNLQARAMFLEDMFFKMLSITDTAKEILKRRWNK